MSRVELTSARAARVRPPSLPPQSRRDFARSGIFPHKHIRGALSNFAARRMQILDWGGGKGEEDCATKRYIYVLYWILSSNLEIRRVIAPLTRAFAFCTASTGHIENMFRIPASRTFFLFSFGKCRSPGERGDRERTSLSTCVFSLDVLFILVTLVTRVMRTREVLQYDLRYTFLLAFIVGSRRCRYYKMIDEL